MSGVISILAKIKATCRQELLFYTPKIQFHFYFSFISPKRGVFDLEENTNEISTFVMM